MMKYSMIFAVLGFVLGVTAGLRDGPGNKVIVDLLLEQQLKELNALLKGDKLTQVELGDYSLPKGKVVARDVRLGDLSTLRATDHAYMWTSPGNVIEAQAFVGLVNMTVDIGSLTFNQQTFPATLTVGVNSLGFHETLTMEQDDCQNVYSEIAFYNLDHVTIYTSNAAYNNQDISEFVKIEILPFVNGLMQKKPFLNLVQEYLDLCNNLPTLRKAFT